MLRYAVTPVVGSWTECPTCNGYGALVSIGRATNGGNSVMKPEPIDSYELTQGIMTSAVCDVCGATEAKPPIRSFTVGRHEFRPVGSHYGRHVWCSKPCLMSLIRSLNFECQTDGYYLNGYQDCENCQGLRAYILNLRAPVTPVQKNIAFTELKENMIKVSVSKG